MSVPQDEQRREELRGLNEQLVLAAVAAQEAAEREAKLRAQLESERDASARLAEVAQRRAAQLQGVLESMVDGVLVWNRAGRVTIANQAALTLFGVARASDLNGGRGVPPDLWVRRPDGSPVELSETASGRALRGEVVSAQDELVADPLTGRDRYLRVSAAPLKDEQGQITGAVAVARDVTVLTELDRLKSQFISIAAHELKTPLAIVKGYAQALARSNCDFGPAPRRMLDAIDRGVSRIDGIVNDLLDLSKLATGRLELASGRIDLTDLATEVADRAALFAPKHHLTVAPSPARVVVRGDPDRLEQVLANLVDNAIKYSPRGGEVTISVVAEEGAAVVAVRDRGVGIPAEHQAHIFERFYSAHTDTPFDYGGMGVGLYICNEIVVRHDGRMWFESSYGQGSTFYFSLPFARSGAEIVGRVHGST